MTEAAGRAPLAVLFGLSGAGLSADERAFFRDCDPLGFCLFKRNIQDPVQTRRLVADLRDAVGRHAPILIDQEGGRVQRLAPPHWPADPPAAAFGRLAARDPEAALAAAQAQGQAIGADLADLGIDVDAAPVADLPVADADPVIGDRAFATAPDTVAALAGAFARGVLAAGVRPVIKHMPGHGRATVDSHHRLPRVSAGLAELDARDFVPFRRLAGDPELAGAWGMTAHIRFDALDPDRPVTQSATAIGAAIRGRIGFSGFLLSDDIDMAALAGPLAERARASLAAGCDAVLQCSGRLEAMVATVPGLSPLTGAALARIGPLPGTARSDPKALRAEVARLLAPGAG